MITGFLAEPAAWLRDSVVQIRQGNSAGSGLTWGWDLIVTNAHVATAGEVEVRLPGGGLRRGVVRVCDRTRDVAVIAVSGLALPTPPRRDSALLRPGHMLFAVGHPFGVRLAVSAGILHAVGPLPDAYPLPATQRRLPWVQADLRLAPGSSGGPIADADGYVIGLSTMIVNGLALAVPVPAVERLVRESAR